MQQINQVTSQNAASSEEMAGNEEELANHAILHMDSVVCFKV